MDGLVPAYPAKSIWSLRRTRQDPVAFLRRLAAEGDIVRFSLGGHPAFLLNHPDHVEDVLVLHHSNFPKPCAFQRSRALFGTGLLTAEGELIGGGGVSSSQRSAHIDWSASARP